MADSAAPKMFIVFGAVILIVIVVDFEMVDLGGKLICPVRRLSTF